MIQSISLGKRLSSLAQHVTADYSNIWDVCCDHGLLGMALLEQQMAPNIHFADIAPQLIESLKTTLENTFSTDDSVNSSWRTHCLDAAHLPLGDYSGKQLIIIAGIGGDLARSIIKQLHASYPTKDIDFLLCPIRQHYNLRSELRALGFRLKRESLVEENKRIYEVLLVTPPRKDNQKLPLVSKTGEQFWQSSDTKDADIAARYHQSILSHYSRKLAKRDADTQRAFEDYQKLTPGIAS